jgi:phosphoglycerate dehydrogenase-like enzyme
MNRYALCVVNFQAALAETLPHHLVVRSTKVSAASISASKDLQLVVRAGECVDNIDLAAAAIAKVEVANRGVPMPMR